MRELGGCGRNHSSRLYKTPGGEGAGQPPRHLLQNDLIEDCPRDQRLLMQAMIANWEQLFRRDALLGQWVAGGV